MPFSATIQLTCNEMLVTFPRRFCRAPVLAPYGIDPFGTSCFVLKRKTIESESFLPTNGIINPRRACARVTVLVLSVCLSVCVCVCFPYSGTSRNQAYKQQYQRLQRDTGMKYKKGFFFKTLRSEVMASFTHLE